MLEETWDATCTITHRSKLLYYIKIKILLFGLQFSSSLKIQPKFDVLENSTLTMEGLTPIDKHYLQTSAKKKKKRHLYLNRILPNNVIGNIAKFQLK